MYRIAVMWCVVAMKHSPIKKKQTARQRSVTLPEVSNTTTSLVTADVTTRAPQDRAYSDSDNSEYSSPIHHGYMYVHVLHVRTTLRSTWVHWYMYVACNRKNVIVCVYE